MGHREGLNDVQVAVLLWIAAGCADGVYEGTTHRITAAALRRRGLIKVTGRGPTWAAELTPAGRTYVEQLENGSAPAARQPNQSVTQQLVAEVVAAGGAKTYPGRSWRPGSIDYERRAALAVRHGKVPDGQRLVTRRVAGGDVEIRLEDRAADDLPLSPPAQVTVPERVSRFHRAVQPFRQTPECQEVSRAQLPRASRILHALATEADRRGWTVDTAVDAAPSRGRSGWTGPSDGHLLISTDGYLARVRITEEGLGSRAQFERTRTEHRWGYVERKEPVSTYEAGATGRLCIELLGHSPSHRVHRWADRRSWRLDDKLGEIITEIELRTVEAHEALEAERRALAERKASWRIAMAAARERFAEQERINHLGAQVAAWSETKRIRAFCDAAERAHPDDPKTAEWVSWARAHADGLDPLRQPPTQPAHNSPQPSELVPFLGGRSPYEFSE